MRSRSRRLFIVLVHVIGVSNHLPAHPVSIGLETLDLRNGLDGLLRQYSEDLILKEPYWLQDPRDELCLGPAGFSECGDATVWYIQKRRPPQHGHRRRCAFFCDHYNSPESGGGYALQLDHGIVVANSHSASADDGGECLIKKRNHKLKITSCKARQAWSWNIQTLGMLVYQPPNQKQLNRYHTMPERTMCVQRNGTTMLLDYCADAAATATESGGTADSPTGGKEGIRFSLVRYNSGMQHQHRQQQLQQQTVGDQTLPGVLEEVPPPTATTTATATAATHIANTKDLAHSHASVPSRPKLGLLQPPSSESKPNHNNNRSNKRHARPKRHTGQPRNHIHTLAPLTLESHAAEPHPMATTVAKKSHDNSNSNNIATLNLRMLQPHPYIAAAKNGMYTDPQTGLQYPTDLCNYLGETKKESGRHSLMGVGQYTKTVFHIKVYGIALYISKRDALADPAFRRYASLSTHELRTLPDFYSLLRTEGQFDRTLLLKLNMQLSTETMRSSLQADWSLLSDERKNLLINTSTRMRPAEAKMLQTIASPANSGRCSCGQVAPEEYNADPSCCARGTELVFTWRKNGNLEMRVDGRIMDIFARPDVAHGIFYEYLRYDAPISLDFREHAVDGFPFLLAPIAQVRKFSTTAIPTPPPPQVVSKGMFAKAVDHLTEIVTCQASELAEWVHGNANGAASNVANAVKTMADSARGMAEEMDRRREQWWTQVSSMPEHGKLFFSQKVLRYPDALAASVTHWLRRKKNSNHAVSAHLWTSDPRTFFRTPASPSTVPANELPVIQATGSLGQQFFVWMVHLYLLLLLIVSLPGSHSTKLVTRRLCKIPSDVESDASTTSSSDEDLLCACPRDAEWKKKESSQRFLLRRRLDAAPKNDESTTTNGSMKKSLSYFL